MQRNTTLLLLLAAAAAPGRADADRRAYGHTYEAVTAPRGEVDVELWTTYARAGEIGGGPASRGLRQMLELEYGVTDRWDVALYNMFDLIEGGDTESGYAGAKLETRFRPTHRGEWIVDPVLYLEAAQLTRGDASHAVEAKLIVAKDLGPWNVATNVAVETEHLRDGTLHPELEYAAGASYQGDPGVSVGVEAFGKVEREDGELEHYAWAGPAVSVAGARDGKGPGMWLTLSGGVRLGDEGDPYYGRVIVGLQF